MLKKLSFSMLLFLICFAQLALAKELDNTKPEQKIQNRVETFKLEVEEFEKSLNLTPEQKTKINEIRSKARTEINLISQEAKLKIRDIRVKANNEIEALLTPEQKDKTRLFREKHKASASATPATNPAR